MTVTDRKLPEVFRNLRLPAVAAPMFIVSGPDLVIAIPCQSPCAGR